MSDMTKAVVVAVGPEAGLGGALCKRLAREGCHVFAAGRTPERVDALVATIRTDGGRATGVPTDTKETDVRAGREEDGLLDLVVYNAGNARWAGSTTCRRETAEAASSKSTGAARPARVMTPPRWQRSPGATRNDFEL